MPPIRAIETRYAGCRFRSRLEARWAVFFDALDIEWQYEPEGFETPAGWCLPDFWLPEHGWVEIKGRQPTEQDFARAAFVDEHSALPRGVDFMFLVGDVPRRTRAPGGIERLVRRYWCGDHHGFLGGTWYIRLGDVKEGVNAALAAARSARFEHGENG